MFDDAFYKIDQGEIFIKTQCMWHEHAVMELLRSMLTNLGYVPKDQSKRQWTRKNKTVIVCLADDFNVCGANLTVKPELWFDEHTTVLTDNHITVATQYQVCQLPTSYYGVFGYQPALQTYLPRKRFCFSVNRLDTQRVLTLLELVRQSESIEDMLEKDLINFNAWSSDNTNQDIETVQKNFALCWQKIKNQVDFDYQLLVDQLKLYMPIRNHGWSIEQCMLESWLTPVMETYSGNTTMAFSEKIFRALQTPAPWTVYSTTGAVDYLKELGFDTLSDVVDHSYNNIEQEPTQGIKKIRAFVNSSIQNYEKLQRTNLDLLQQRCQQAALHNQRLLAQHRQQFPQDFTHWLLQTVETLC